MRKVLISSLVLSVIINSIIGYATSYSADWRFVAPLILVPVTFPIVLLLELMLIMIYEHWFNVQIVHLKSQANNMPVKSTMFSKSLEISLIAVYTLFAFIIGAITLLAAAFSGTIEDKHPSLGYLLVLIPASGIVLIGLYASIKKVFGYWFYALVSVITIFVLGLAVIPLLSLTFNGTTFGVINYISWQHLLIGLLVFLPFLGYFLMVIIDRVRKCRKQQPKPTKKGF